MRNVGINRVETKVAQLDYKKMDGSDDWRQKNDTHILIQMVAHGGAAIFDMYRYVVWIKMWHIKKMAERFLFKHDRFLVFKEHKNPTADGREPGCT